MKKPPGSVVAGTAGPSGEPDAPAANDANLIRVDLARAARQIDAADAIIITAGAGMGVDSGLPDFRGDTGFWKAYPALGKARIGFAAIANPAAFRRDARLAWGFYGHRLGLYRTTVPHAGFAILRNWAARMAGGAFMVTSNVDGQFAKAGFAAERMLEIHGSIHHLQCLAPCGARIWSAADFTPEVDTAQCRLVNEPPHCPACRGLARPNILMFGDWDWQEERTTRQEQAFAAWRARVRQPVVIELGAGIDIPTIRLFGERQDAPLIRINPRAPAVRRSRDVGLPLGALAGLQAIDARLQRP